MIYEHRAYYILPGKLPEFVEEFGKVSAPVLERHGAKLVGMWTPVIGQSNEVVYILAFNDLGHREEVWAKVFADEEMRAYLRRTNTVHHIESKIFRPVPYSPLQ